MEIRRSPEERNPRCQELVGRFLTPAGTDSIATPIAELKESVMSDAPTLTDEQIRTLDAQGGADVPAASVDDDDDTTDSDSQDGTDASDGTDGSDSDSSDADDDGTDA